MRKCRESIIVGPEGLVPPPGSIRLPGSQGIKQNHFKYSEIVRGHYSVTSSSLVLFFAIN